MAVFVQSVVIICFQVSVCPRLRPNRDLKGFDWISLDIYKILLGALYHFDGIHRDSIIMAQLDLDLRRWSHKKESHMDHPTPILVPPMTAWLLG